MYDIDSIVPATLIKNCDPPDSGAPVLAILNVPAVLPMRCVNSSGIPPSSVRV